MGFFHANISGANLHNPKGIYPTALVLPASQASAYLVEDTTGYDYLAINTDTPSVVWGSTTLAATPTHTWKLPTAQANAFLIEDYQGNDWLRFNTTAGINLPKAFFGNAVTNPHLEWLGTGAMWLGGSAGTAGQAFTSNGPSAAPSWTTVSTAGITDTTALSFTVNVDAVQGVDEDPAYYMLGGNGATVINRAYFVTDSSAGVTYFRRDTNTSGGGYTRATPTFAIGTPSSSASFLATFGFRGGDGTNILAANINLVSSVSAAALTFDVPITSAGAGGGSCRFGLATNPGGTNDAAFGGGTVTGSTGGNTVAGVNSTCNGGNGSYFGQGGGVSAASGCGMGQAVVIDAAATGGIANGRAAALGASAVGSIVFSNGSSLNLPNTFSAGSNIAPIATVIWGEGDSDATPPSVTHRQTNALSGSGTGNVAGGNTTYVVSRSNGTGLPGDFVWQGNALGSSGNALNAAVERARLTGLGYFGLGNVGASVPAHLYVLDNDSSTAAMFVLDQDGAGDAAMRFDAGSESWIVGCDNSDSDAFKVSESTALGTTDRIWAEANEGAINLRTHADGAAGEQLRIKTKYIQTTNATYTAIWSYAMGERENAIFEGFVSGQGAVTTRHAAYRRIEGYYRESGGATTVIPTGVGDTGDRFDREDVAAYDARFALNGSTVEFQVRGETGHTVNWAGWVVMQVLAGGP